MKELFSVKGILKNSLLFGGVAVLLFLIILQSRVHAAEESLCARVKIEIKQELTLERQTFDAHMKITNGLSHIALENVGITVKFKDEEGNVVLASTDPQNTEAKFFIGQPTLSGINDAMGSGTISPSSVADINWLIIPVPGASKGNQSGTLYYVGATLTYTSGGDTTVTEVSPDFIYVKPMPEMTIDYFLTKDVFGDDAFTQAIELPVPFTLGVRIKNTGQGTAKGMSINSAQPKIIENNQGLLIGFNIESAEVNGRPAGKTLMASLGDIKPATAAVARWIMNCTLSGEFKEFKAEYSHADELGGQLTSLITGGPFTRWLVRDVLVDLPGRDEIRDFLALDGSFLRIYESENASDDIVTDQSGSSTLTGSGNQYALSTPLTAGFMYVKLPDPNTGQKEITEVIRSDGKRIKPANVWLSKTRTESQGWNYFINIFDVHQAVTLNPVFYTIVSGDPAALAPIPVLQFIPDRSVMEGQQISFIVEASIPGGGMPKLSTSSLPVGASFMDQGTGTGFFSWSTAVGQAGQYYIIFTAENGTSAITQRAKITVYPAGDTDNDGLPDAWEMQYFGSLERNGSGDFDGDGITDLQEYLQGKDPTSKDVNTTNRGPNTPNIQVPQDREEVVGLQPVLTVANATDPDGDSLIYSFEIYSDEEMMTQIASISNVAEGTGTTEWQTTVMLTDHRHYYWRSRATDGLLFSPWAYGSFFVNTANDTPGEFKVSSPLGGGVDKRMPVLAVTNSKDIDEDSLTYTFLVYSDSAMTNLVAADNQIAEGLNGTTAWTVNVQLADNTQYYWKAVTTDVHGAQRETVASSFMVKTANHAPLPPVIQNPTNAGEIVQNEAVLTVLNSTDSDSDALAYIFEVDKVNTFDSSSLRVSGTVSPGTVATEWTVDLLDDNTVYFWRVKANDVTSNSAWTLGSFFVNTANDAPLTPVLKNPGESAWVDTLTPILAVHPAKDNDRDNIRYRYQIYSDINLTALIEEKETDNLQFKAAQLADKTWYYWRALSIDEHSLESAWSEKSSFFVKNSGAEQPLEISIINPSQDEAVKGSYCLAWGGHVSSGNNATCALYYDADNNGLDGALIVAGLAFNEEGNSYLWDTTGIPEGEYYIYATITSGDETASAYSSARLSIDRTPPYVSIIPAGGTFNSTQSVTITTNEEATVYFTLDRMEPDESSAIYTSPVQVAESSTLKTIAVDRAGNRSAIASAVYIIQKDIAVYVQTNSGAGIVNIKVYAFTAAGAYTGKNATTDESGIGSFNPTDFAAGSYKFRVDYRGYQFWSSVVALPDTSNITIQIEEAQADILVETSSGPTSNITVYLFTEGGSYLSISRQTSASGVASFNIPVGKNYKFRADIMGNQYWSTVQTITGGSVHNIDINAGGGILQLILSKVQGVFIAGITTYLYNAAGSYLGKTAATDASGTVQYSVPAGNYKIRVDYLGYQFWSAVTAVTINTNVDMTIAHQDITVAVNGEYQGASTPVANVPVYLFKPSGVYLNASRQTNEKGQVTFNLPESAYKVRSDYLSQSFWSATFTWGQPTVSIPLAEAAVTVSGSNQPNAGVMVYVFSATGSYLNVSGNTDTNGAVRFRLPAGSYKFRANYQLSQFWSSATALAANEVTPVDISTGAGNLEITILKGTADPLTGVMCYVFNSAGSYLGISGTTNSNGQIIFNLASGSYKFRVDYMGYPFWSNVVTLPDTGTLSMLIEHADVGVKAETTAGPAVGVPVDLFTESGSYLGVSLQTDTDGMAAFRLPIGVNYKFRTDILGNQYWSSVNTITGGGPNNISINAGGGTLQVVVLKGIGVPLEGAATYLFNNKGSYLSRNGQTDAAGVVQYDVPEGSYKVRVDYLGHQFWTELFIVSGNLSIDFLIAHQDVGVTVRGIFQQTYSPIVAVPVYLFNSLGAYMGQNRQTDSSGHAAFKLPQVEYEVRTDYLGQSFWSEPFIWQDAIVDVPMADAVVTITGSGQLQAGIPVYVFNSEGSYLGITKTTESDGQATFRLPSGSYNFRADYQTHQYWSGEDTLAPDETKSVSVSTGGGNFTLTVNKALSEPLVGVPCYVFNQGGSYIGLSGITNDAGQVGFDLSSGSYKFRVDYMGYQFWSDTFDISVPSSGDFTIPNQDITLNLKAYYQTSLPIPGVKTYLFTTAGSYVSQSKTTNADGQVIYRLPDRIYKIRADYLGHQFWSDSFLSQNVDLTIQEGVAIVHVQKAGSYVNGATVYLFSETGSYLGLSAVTDSLGKAVLTLPNRNYKFRVDAGGGHFWSPIVTIVSGIENPIAVNCD